MFDFRYHVISLVAVFLALGIGILLGVTVAETGVVSGVERNLERSLRDDLHRAQADESRARSDLAHRDDFGRQIYPTLVSGLLRGERVGVVATGKLPSGVASDIRQALVPTGANLVSISVIRLPVDLHGLAGDVAGTRFADLDVNRNSLGEFAKHVGRQLVTGGGFVTRVRDTLMASRSGTRRTLDAVIYARLRPDLSAEDGPVANRFEPALVDGLTHEGVPVVGVEQTQTDPSQIGYFRDRGLTTVDDTDEVSGRVALVYALLGAKGSYGVKASADQLLPQTLVPARAGRRR